CAGRGHAPPRPFRAGVLEREVGFPPAELGWAAPLLEPRLAAAPAEPDQEIRGRGERVRHAVDEVAPAVAVEIHGVLVVIRRRELHRPELAGPVPDHLARRKIAALDDAQRVEQLRAEEFRPAAIVGERGHRTQDRGSAVVGAEIALQAPECNEHRRGDAVLLVDAREQRGVLLHQPGAGLQAVARYHPVGELQKGLLKDALAVVAVDDGLVEGHAVEPGRDRRARDALGGGFLLEALGPALRGPGIVAAAAAFAGAASAAVASAASIIERSFSRSILAPTRQSARGRATVKPPSNLDAGFAQRCGGAVAAGRMLVAWMEHREAVRNPGKT